MFTDIVLITYVWFLSLLLQLIAAPIIMLHTKKVFADAGWALGRITSWIGVSLLIWFMAHAMLPVNQNWFVYALMIGLLGCSLWMLWLKKQEIVSIWQSRRGLIITEEILFAIGLYGLSLIRAFNPAILDLEKFMDVGFMASYLRAPTLPAPDMWLSGKTINYYSFGHYMGSIMTRFWNLPLSYSYNLLLGFICGLGLTMSFSIVVNYLPKIGQKFTEKLPIIIAGLIGSLLVVVAGNTHTIWFKLTKGTWQGYWYADATRFIENTIHEFPSYSFVVSDIHGHVWDFPIVLTFLLVYRLWLHSLLTAKKTVNRIMYSIFLGLLLGVMTMTSMWDLMIYGLLLVITGLILVVHQFGLFFPLLQSAGIAFVTLAIAVTPFFLNFESISEGIALVSQRSPLSQLFILWTGHVALSAAALIVAILCLRMTSPVKSIIQKDRSYAWGMIAIVSLGWLLILLPELFYVKDIYTGHPRANTMFKLTYQGFIVMSLAGAWGLGYIWLKINKRRLLQALVTLPLLGIVIALTPFPYFAYRDYYGALKTHKGLDGWQWLKEQYPDDYNLMLWMNANIKGQPVILESWGESYTTFNRISAYTGLPTVIGWRVHEWLWRGGFDIAGERSGHVDTIYKNPLSNEAQELLDRYQVEYIVIGSKEIEAYPDTDLTPVKSLGSLVYRSGDTLLIKRTPLNASVMQ